MVRKLVLATVLVSGFGSSAASASPVTMATTGGTLTGVNALGGAFGAQQVGWPSTDGIESFPRVQQHAGEQGNTSLGTPLGDDGGQIQRVWGLGELPMLDMAGIEYRQFLLDVDQVDKESLLSVDQIQILILGSASGGDDALVPPTRSDALIPGSVGAGWLEAFRLNNAVPAYELVDYDLNPDGGDTFLHVANLLVAAGHSNAILDSLFGQLALVNAADGGLTEGAAGQQQQCVDCEPVSDGMPEAGSLVLLGAGLLLGAVALGDRRQHRRRRHHRRRSFRR